MKKPLKKPTKKPSSTPKKSTKKRSSELTSNSSEARALRGRPSVCISISTSTLDWLRARAKPRRGRGGGGISAVIEELVKRAEREKWEGLGKDILGINVTAGDSAENKAGVG